MNFYTFMSNFYDILDVTYFRDKENNPRSAISDLIQGENINVLDVCCGTLANTVSAAKVHKNAKFYGIDRSENMLINARKNIVRNNLGNVRIKCLDAADTKLKSGSFDYIIIGLALHEMSPDLQQSILKEAHRLLKPQGKLLVLEWEKPQSFIRKMLFFPLMIIEQLLCGSFLQFYNRDKNAFFKDNDFYVCSVIHCSYSAVYELSKRGE